MGCVSGLSLILCCNRVILPKASLAKQLLPYAEVVGLLVPFQDLDD